MKKNKIILTKSDYKTTTEKEFVGRRCENIVPLSNGRYRIPAGVTWTIKRKWKGFDLESDPCSCCGVSVFITEVDPCKIRFIEQISFNWPKPAEKIE
ncbi:MAG: hypothetical protein PHD09_03930 [Candidatus Omnitrophica bacterium]|jgi:hypothetical protein|nr:hypothetical protein [Candidatus Omnitrophota bacterium]